MTAPRSVSVHCQRPLPILDLIASPLHVTFWQDASRPACLYSGQAFDIAKVPTNDCLSSVGIFISYSSPIARRRFSCREHTLMPDRTLTSPRLTWQRLSEISNAATSHYYGSSRILRSRCVLHTTTSHSDSDATFLHRSLRPPQPSHGCPDRPTGHRFQQRHGRCNVAEEQEAPAGESSPVWR